MLRTLLCLLLVAATGAEDEDEGYSIWEYEDEYEDEGDYNYDEDQEIPGLGIKLEAATALLSSGYGSLYTADRCNDGNNGNFCHSGHEKAPWLALDFGSTASVATVVIHNRATSRERLRNVQVRVSDELPKSGSEMFTGGQLLGTFEGEGRKKIVVNSTTGTELRGRYVVIQIDNGQEADSLNLAEVTAWREQDRDGRKLQDWAGQGTEPTPSEEGKGNLTATIVAVTVSVVLAILGVLLAVFLWRRRTTPSARQVPEVPGQEIWHVDDIPAAARGFRKTPQVVKQETPKEEDYDYKYMGEDCDEVEEDSREVYENDEDFENYENNYENHEGRKNTYGQKLFFEENDKILI